jgi:hypothetical protein
MSREVVREEAPRIAVRVPGPWTTPDELAARLPAGFRIEGEQFVTCGGRRFGFEAMPADGAFPTVFRSVCRRPPQPAEASRLDRYAMNAAVVAPGGSLAAAQRILEAVAGVVRAGGIGVFIDNCAVAHGGSDWLELAEHRHDPSAVFYTFVTIVKSGKDLVSYGMQVFGQRDAVIAHRTDLHDALSSVEDFLRVRCADPQERVDGGRFCDEQGRQFRLRREPDRNPFGRQHPMSNPYGRWRLERTS